MEVHTAECQGDSCFSKDGKIEGLDRPSWYDPVIDYVGYPIDIDQLLSRKRLRKDNFKSCEIKRFEHNFMLLA